MSQSPLPQVEPVPPDVGLRPLILRQLIRAMFGHRLVTGDRLVVSKLATQLGASSTPVREALLELSTLGLVELIPNRGAVCLPFGAAQLREMYLVRRVLEVEATRRAAEKLARDDDARSTLGEIRSTLASLRERGDAMEGWLHEAVRVDVVLHDLIAENCGSPRLCHEIGRYKELMVCVRESVGNEHSVQQIALEEHAAIVEHLLAGEADRAAEAMGRHLDHTAELAATVLFPPENRRPAR